MTVLLFNWSDGLGGAERFTVDLAKRLVDLGLRAVVVFVTAGERMAAELRTAGVEVETLGLSRGREVVRRIPTLRRLVRATGATAAILPTVGYLASVVRLAGLRGPLLGIDHGSVLQIPSLPPRSRWREEIDRVLGVASLTHHVCVSEAVHDAANARPHGRGLCVIYNGVDTMRYAPFEDETAATAEPAPFVIGFAARLIKGKGADILLDAVDSTEWPRPVTVRIAGDGPLRPILENRARDLPAGVTARFLGRIEDMPSFYRASHVIATPPDTVIDSFCLVAAEAMACGTPVVASAAGGIPEVVADGIGGLLVPPGDAAALRAALRRYADDPVLRRAHALAARRIVVERFSIDESARRYAALLATS